MSLALKLMPGLQCHPVETTKVDGSSPWTLISFNSQMSVDNFVNVIRADSCKYFKRNKVFPNLSSLAMLRNFTKD